MIRIRIVCGTYGYRPNGAAHPIPVDRGQCCDVPEDEAKRLMSIGVAQMTAESVTDGVATDTEKQNASIPADGITESENGAEGKETARINLSKLKKMTNERLRELANELGINTAKLKTKAHLINAIIAVGDTQRTEEPPMLGVEAPVV